MCFINKLALVFLLVLNFRSVKVLCDMYSLWRRRGPWHVLRCSDQTRTGSWLLHWEGLPAQVQSTDFSNLSAMTASFSALVKICAYLYVWWDGMNDVFQVGGKQLERVLQDLWGGFPVSSSSLLEDALAGPGQLGLQWPLHHGRPGETCGETSLQEPRLRSTVGGGRVDGGMTHRANKYNMFFFSLSFKMIIRFRV